MRATGTPACTCSNIKAEPISGLGAPELIPSSHSVCSSCSKETQMLASQRDLFEMPRHVCYLNSASYSPLPLKTQEAGRAAVLRKATPWTLDAAFANTQHERARAAAAHLIHADAADIALIPSISYGVATAAKVVTIARGARVLVLENDHSSPVLEWQSRAEAQGFVIETVRQPDDGDWTSAVLPTIERTGAPPVGPASISSALSAERAVIGLGPNAPPPPPHAPALP